MKRAILIIAIVLSSIVSPVMANANGSTEVDTTNPILQKQELKLPWYKALKYEIGYSGGICLNSEALGVYHDIVDNNFTWFNTLDISIILPGKKSSIGLKYGWWPLLKNRWGLDIFYENYDTSIVLRTGGNWAIYYNGIFIKYYKTKSFYYGISINHFIANTEEKYGLTINGVTLDKTAIVQRKCIGAEIFCGLERHILLKKFDIIPFVKLQIGYAKEYHNNSPWEWGNNKLTISTSGVFAGIKVRFGGGK